MIGWDTRVLLKHYLEQGLSQAEIARRLGINRKTIYRWVRSGQLDQDVEAGLLRYKPRPKKPTKLDPYKPFIRTRLEEYLELSAVRLFAEVQAAGYEGGLTQLKLYVREVRPKPPAEPVVRFETAPGEQAQVSRDADFCDVSGVNPVRWTGQFPGPDMSNGWGSLQVAAENLTLLGQGDEA